MSYFNVYYMSFLEELKDLFHREKCERAINYDKRTLEIKAKAEAPGIPFSLGDFKTEVRKIREASEFAEALDDYQYQMCKICKGLRKNDPEWRKYNKLRVGTIQLLTTLRINLLAFKADPEGHRDKLYDIVTRLQDYLLLVAREVIPNIEDVKSKYYISKGDIPDIKPTVVSKALDIAGLNEYEVERFIVG